MSKAAAAIAPLPAASPSAKPKPKPDGAPQLASYERAPDRFELKYWVPEAMIPLVLEYARPWLIADPFNARMGLLRQHNTSLYLETPALAFYNNHVEHAPDRFKLRVRAYGDPPSGTSFFEVKRKINQVCVKTRAAVPLDKAAALLDGTWDALPDGLRPADRRCLENFLYLQMITHARPHVLVRAHRESYCTPDPFEDVRMTFDRDICFQPARGSSFVGDPARWTPIDGELQHGRQGPHTLVELKFPGIAPPWMGELVERLEMLRVSYSKYVNAVTCLLDENYAADLALDAAPARRA